ncbi:hypothetical protein DFR67_10857 [Williamsia limnetica]|uniref:EthD domain-containing protein n=1 Tax=Williamsia limnetica TaxID=882452 RepID=A0A318RIY1_WILLI|nr:hypothetical protein [Williamsia limnetica]PYE16306.1 hypothetical protein DFR67_10857 [Williamsia limnetica]
MSAAVLFAWSSPTSQETDAEFNQWYDTVHAPQVKEAIGTEVRLNRYLLSEPNADNAATVPRYLAVYEFSDTDVATAHAALMGAFKGRKFDMSPTIDSKAGSMQWYTPVQ